MTLQLVALATAFAAGLGTWLVRAYARSHNVLDVPNDRSSHTIATPRGGGAAIVLAMLSAVAVLWKQGAVSASSALAMLGAGSAVAGIGFLDDHRPVPARVRLAVHFSAAAWALWWVGLPLASRSYVSTGVPAALGYLVGAVAVVWMLNLWNFMDGIDGLAASEALFVCAAAVSLRVIDGAPIPPLTLLLGAATFGFLVWNFPPASIFMGDVGSGFLGLALAVTGVVEFAATAQQGAAWLILPAFFACDATVTLLRRWQQGIPVATAHRTHAYQHLTGRYRSHRRVTLSVAVLNVCYLLPLAVLTNGGHLTAALGLAAAYIPLAGMVWLLDAGVERSTA